ncbi:Vacuolar protein-sorting-associated protein 27 [Savitreella phatthalungensis]
MSWFGGGSNAEMDDLVERASSSTLPTDSEDLALNLEICDRIRSKTIPARDAMRSLKKRLSSKNPNVQLHTLRLTDLAVKNGGSHFLTEIASREFVDNLVSLLRFPQGLNEDVKSKLLELIQSWGLAFETKPQLSYLTAQYRDLQRSGAFDFPPEQRLADSMVDTAAPPEWADSDVCMRCRTAFSFTNRKHHCRNCGQVFCGQCSSQVMPLPQLGITEAVRVCDGCFNSKAAVQSSTFAPASVQYPKPVQQPQPTDSYSQAKRSAQPAREEQEDLDLKRALELSLAESKQSQAQSTRYSAPPVAKTAPVQTTADDDDPDMRAAIQASLQEMKLAEQQQQSKPRDAYSYPDLSASSVSAAYTPSNPIISVAATGSSPPLASSATKPRQDANELSLQEAENINLFASLVEKLKHNAKAAGGGGSSGVLADAQVQELYDQISTLRPKMARSLAHTIGRYEKLVDTHAKLQTVVRYYDRLLESRLAGAGYASRSAAPMQHDYYGVAAPQRRSDAANGYYGRPSGVNGAANAPYPASSDPAEAAYHGGASTTSAYAPQQAYARQGQFDQSHAYGHSGQQPYSTFAQPANARTASEPQEEASLIDL